MRIAQITYSTKPRGGVVHTLALSEELARRGHDVEVWTLARGGDQTFFRAVDPAVTVRAVEFPHRDGESVGERIERSIQTMAVAFDSDAEVLHAQDCISANALIRSPSVMRSGNSNRGCPGSTRPVIRTIHHLDEFTTPRLVECHDHAVNDPHARLCVSEAVARQVEEKYGVRPAVITNGVDADRFAHAADATPSDSHVAARREAFVAELGPYVLALGGIEPRKGSLDLLEGFALFKETHPEAQLVFGGGETLFDYRYYREEFDRRAAELGVEPVILGVLDDEDVPALMAGATALGFISTNEGFGLAAMEALAAGVPVVARDLPVFHDVFGEAVLYTRTHDDIAEAFARIFEAAAKPGAEHSAANPGVVDFNGAGRELAFAHSWATAAELHEAFYEAVLAQGGDRGEAITLPDLASARRVHA